MTPVFKPTALLVPQTPVTVTTEVRLLVPRVHQMVRQFVILVTLVFTPVVTVACGVHKISVTAITEVQLPEHPVQRSAKQSDSKTKIDQK